MCGIVGIVNGKKNRSANARLCSYMRDAIVANSLRGMDSTGIVQQSKDKRYLVNFHKDILDGTAFAGTREVGKYLNNVDDTAFTFVHNRAATRGEVTEENAHPFQHTNDSGQWLIGCHNGTLNGWFSRNDFKVDSDWALSEIAYDGVDAFEKLEGAYTFVWYGHREGNVLNIVRNEQRPMYVAFVKDEDRMLFASEHLMMVWLAARNNIQLEPDIIDLTPGILYQFDLDNPREFKKSQVPRFKTIGPQERLISEVKRIFGAVVKAPPKQKPVTESVIILPPPSNKKQKRQLKQQQEKNKNQYVTADEARIVKHLEYAGLEMSMVITEYIAADNELWGVAKHGADEFTCVIRHVNKALADTWKRAGSLSARVVGAKMFERHGIKELSLILSRKAKATEEELDEFSAAVAERIGEFTMNKGKSDNESGSVH
jgi:hypothetical protein